MFAAVGFGLAAAASVSLNGQLAPLPLLVSAAVGFGFFVSTVRSKIFRLVGAATVLVVGHTVGTIWFTRQDDLKHQLSGTHVARPVQETARK